MASLWRIACMFALVAAPPSTPPAAAAAAPAPEAGFAGPRLASDSRNAVVAVGALDDPANPFREFYSDYDRWVWEHYAPRIEAEVLKAFSGEPEEATRAVRERCPAGWAIRRATVDEQGWLLPSAGLPEEPRPLREILFGNLPPSGTPRAVFFSFLAAGVMAPELLELADAQRQLRYLKALPPIPAWLGEHPPLQTVFVPNGEILTYGPLDLHFEEEEESGLIQHYGQVPEGESWYRYDRDGKLLEAFPGGLGHFGYWHAVYGTTADDLPPPETGGGNAIGFRGRYLLRMESVGWQSGTTAETYKPPQVLAAMDYDGTPVELDQPATHAEIEASSPLDREALAKYYQTQLALGLTSADSLSPFWGRPDGPVAVDPAPRPRPRRARRYEDRERFIDLRPLDDPASPYRGRYGPLEAWAWENANSSRFPRVRKAGERLPDSEAYAAGRTGYEERLQFYTDSAGFIIPAAEVFILPSELGLAPYPDLSTPALTGAYSFSASGEMPAALWDELCRRVWEMGLKDFPPLPDWLLAGGRSAVVFLPDGTLLAQPQALAGEAGGLPEFELRGLALYSADGREIRRGEAKNIFNWPEFFDPAFAQKQEEAQRQGYSAYLQEGYLKVRPAGATPDSPPVAAYTYSGIPVEPAFIKPLAPGICQVLQSYQLERIYHIQRYMTTRRAAP